MKYKNDGSTEGKVLKFPDKFQPKEEEPKKADFSIFAFAILGGQVELAGKVLSSLLNLNEKDGLDAASHYHDCYQKDHEIQTRAMHIKTLIRSDKNSEALMEIHKCFGLQGPPAIAALESMRAML